MDHIQRMIRGWGVILGVPALFIAAYIYPLIPVLGRIKVCAVKGFLNYDCPGCGLIRSFGALTHGRFRQSIDYHPLGIIIAVWLLYLFVRSAAGRACGRQIPELLSQYWRDVVLFVFLAALIVQWGVKLALAC